MKKRMALMDIEEKYVSGLAEILEQRNTFPFEVVIYSNIEILKKELKNGLVDLVLITDVIIKDEELPDTDKPVILLETGIKMDGKRPGIRKYRSGETIRKELLKLYSEYKSNSENEGEYESITGGYRETKIIGVYSPVGRCLQTSFSVLLGQLLSKKASTLYLNFEPFSGLRKELGYDDGKDLTNLVYYMRGGANRLVYKLESLICNLGGLDYIAPTSSFVDLCSVEEEDWLTLIETLKQQSDYEYIILDLSESVTGLMNVLRRCNRIYTITKSDVTAVSKQEEYEDTLRELDYEDILNKTKKCALPYFKALPMGVTNLEHSELATYLKSNILEELADGI